MKPNSVTKWITGWLSGKPHFVIGNDYLHRWYVIPRNRLINVYLHRFLHDDEDRALHDHPWWFVSIMLRGGYAEVVLGDRCVERHAPSLAFRNAEHAHRVVLFRNPFSGAVVKCWTLVITGRVVRDWGFLCPQGWRHWKQFTSADDYGQTGRGCD